MAVPITQKTGGKRKILNEAKDTQVIYLLQMSPSIATSTFYMHANDQIRSSLSPLHDDSPLYHDKETNVNVNAIPSSSTVPLNSTVKYMEKSVPACPDVSKTYKSTESSSFQIFEQNSSKPKTVSRIPKDKAHKYDIGLYHTRASTLTDEEKLSLIKNVWVPPTEYEFPKTNDRKFSPDYLEDYPYLCYSEYLDGAFCLPCVLFGHLTKEKSPLKNLFSQPLQSWKSARSRLDHHYGKGEVKSKCKMHVDALRLFAGFMRSMVQREIAINIQKNEEVQRNREAIKAISDTVIFLGREGLPFWGHTDESKSHASVGGHSINSAGLLVNMLNFQAQRGDVVLREHLSTAEKYALYTSAPIQNQLIECAGRIISKKLIDEINNSGVFAFFADEATDCSIIEQMALIIRFVDKDDIIREEFLGYIYLDAGLNGVNVKDKILEFIRECGIDMNKCRGQGYDGAGNMSGCRDGCATLISANYPFATYFHRACHRLNLAIQKSCSVTMVRNVMGIVKQILRFFNLSQKRQHNLLKHAEVECPHVTREKLSDVCRTSWITRIDGMDDFQNLLPAVITSLEEMEANEERYFDRDTCASATVYLKTIASFEFIVSLVISRNILHYARPATVKLQLKERDILEGYELIETLRNTIKLVIDDIDTKHQPWYDEAVELAKSVNVKEEMPRFPKESIYRCNPPSATPSQYYRQSISIPTLNHLLTELDDRFSHSSKPYLDAMRLVPDLLISAHYSKVDWITPVIKFGGKFRDDLPRMGSLRSELDIWLTYWTGQNISEIPDSLSSTLKVVDKDAFPNIYAILKILAVTPITTCSCQRTISGLRRLKDYTMGQERLNGLALLHVHKEIPVSSDEVLTEFANTS